MTNDKKKKKFLLISKWKPTETRIIIMLLKYIIIGTRLDILKSYKIIIVKVKR